MSRQFDSEKVVGFIGGTNTRNAWPWMAEQGLVMFPSELTGEDDKRKPVYNMLFGKEATEKSRKDVLTLVRKHDSDGPDSQYALTLTIHADGQQQPGKVRQEPEGLKLYSGARRWFGGILANIMDSNFPAKFLADLTEELDDGKLRDLGVVLNQTQKSITPSEEGRRYFELKEAGLTDSQIAMQLKVFGPGGKPNVQRVAMYRKLWHPNVTDADRAKLDAGTASLEKILKKVRSGKGGGGGGGSAVSVEKSTTRQRTMKYEDLLKIYNDPATIAKYLGYDDKNTIEAVRFGIGIALGLVTLPEEPAQPEVKEEQEPASDAAAA